VGQRITIKAENISLDAELNDSVTAKAILQTLPIKENGNRWGGEIYFAIDVSQQLDNNSRDVLNEGELGYWPTGNAFCIFFGSTPASTGSEIRAASAVNIIGKVIGAVDSLWDIKDGTEITIERKNG
jgi:uncharacterized protein